MPNPLSCVMVAMLHQRSMGRSKQELLLSQSRDSGLGRKVGVPGSKLTLRFFLGALPPTSFPGSQPFFMEPVDGAIDINLNVLS